MHQTTLFIIVGTCHRNKRNLVRMGEGLSLHHLVRLHALLDASALAAGSGRGVAAA